MDIERKQINSIGIRTRHPKIYEDFFSKCQIVVSSADSFFWSGEYSRFYGGLTILQKLPTKTMVGLEFIQDSNIELSSQLFGYNPSRDQFDIVPFDIAKEKRLLAFLNKYWKEEVRSNPDINGVRIHMLSEAHTGGGLGTTGVLITCLAACLLIMQNKLAEEDINKWSDKTINSLLHSTNYDQKFKEVFELSWRMSSYVRDGKTSGSTNFCALIRTPYPIVYINDKSSVARKEKSNSDMKIWASSLNELFDLHLPQPWPIDIGRIYSGKLVNTENIFKALSWVKLDYDTIKSELKNLKSKKLDDSPKIEIISWHHDSERGGYCDEYIKILNAITVKTLLNLKHLFENGPNEESLRSFCDVINEGREFNYFLGQSTVLLDKICDFVVEEISLDNEFGLSASRIEGIGRGGHVLFAGPANGFSTETTQKIYDFSQKNNKNIFLDWASWMDGFGESGIEIEQNLKTNILSNFIDSKDYSVTSFKQGKSTNTIVKDKELEKIFKTYDLVLFNPKNKVYINNEKISSCELPSSKATIEIFKQLLNEPSHKIKNKIIPNQSYAQNRYDLQSKIFIPLEKLLKSKCSKELYYKISGGMYDDYEISLKYDNLNIALVDFIQ